MRDYACAHLLELLCDNVHVCVCVCVFVSTCVQLHQGCWAALGPITACASTRLKNYEYAGGLDVLSSDALLTKWDEIPELTIEWEPGDLLFVRTNRIHAGPPNVTDHHRHLMFVAGTAGSTEYTDTGMRPAHQHQHKTIAHAYMHTHRTQG